MSRYVSPVETITDRNGAPMVGAKLVFYETGTATLKTVYSDSGLSVPIANPVTAVSSDAGAIYPDIYLDGIYKVVQQDDTGTDGVADGVVLWTRDPVGDIATGNFETWLNDSTYSIPEVVYASDDNYYISLVDANQGNEPSVSPAQWQLIPMKDMVGLTETQTLTNKHIPVIYDSTANEIAIFAEVASAVNEPTVTNAASGNKPSINQTGTDDVGLDIEGVELHNGVVTGVRAIIDTIAGTFRQLLYRTSGLNRWQLTANADVESGSDAGSNFEIFRYDDAGTTPTSTFTIRRSDGLATIENLAPISAGTAIAGQALSGIGTYAFLGNNAITRAPGETELGSALAYCNSSAGGTGTPSGTWRCMGNGTATLATVWLRIS